MRLSHLAMVNWHLFDYEDIAVSGHIGILGENRSGKSTILDMVQVVLAGSSPRFYRLNAVANDAKRSSGKRTVYGYCLGTLGEGVTRRTSSLTYAVLGFTDPEGDRQPVSIGLCLEARESERVEDVIGRFIVKGRILTKEDLLDRSDPNRLVPKRWEDLKADLDRESGVEFTNYRETAIEFIRAYMRILVPNRPYDAKNAEAMLKALVNAITLKQDLTAEQFMRQFILEEKPIEIRQLRTSIETYRSVSSTIATLRAKLEHLVYMRGTIEDYASNADRSRLEEWIGRRARYLSSLALNRAFFAERNEAQARIAGFQEEIDGYEEDIRETGRDLDDIRALLRAHADKSGRREAVAAGDRARERISEIDKIYHRRRSAFAALSQEIAVRPGSYGSRVAPLSRMGALLQTTAIADLTTRDFELEREAMECIREVARANESILQRIRDDASEERRVARDLGGRLGDRTGVARLGAHLSNDTSGLMSLLRSAGMDPQPLCDIVRIREASREWTLAAEGLLGRDREAIFVDERHVREATRIAREVKSQFREASLVSVHKLKRFSDQPTWGTFPSIFESDHADAMRFIRQRHDGVRLAMTPDEFEQPGRAIMQDGYYDDGLVRRPRHPRQGDYKIGKDAQMRMVAGLQARLEEAVDRLAELATQETKQKAVESAINLLVDPDFDRLAGLAGRLQEALKEKDASERTISAIDAAGDGGLTERRNEVAGLLERQKKALKEVEDKTTADKVKVAWAERMLTSSGPNTPGSNANVKLTRQMYSTSRKSVAYGGNGRAAYRARLEALASGYPNERQDQNGLRLMAKAHDDLQDRAGRDKSKADTEAIRLEKEIIKQFGDYIQEFGASGQVGRDSEILTEMRPYVAVMIADIEDNALRQHEAKAKEASDTAAHLFRTQFVLELKNRMDLLKGERHALNRTLAAHKFHKETYSFRMTAIDRFSPIIKMADLADRETGLAEQDPLDLLFDDNLPKDHENYETIKAVRSLLEDPDIVFEDFEDYRNFYTFDIIMTDENGRVVEWEKRRGTGSGAEQQVPIYVAVGASLAAVYGTSEAYRARGRSGMAPALFDEAFSRMDGKNQRQMMAFYESLGLQVVIAAPMEKKIALQAYMETIVEIDRIEDRANADVTMIKERTRNELLDIDPDNRTEEELRSMLEAAE